MHRLKHIIIPPFPSEEEQRVVVFPNNLLRRFVQIADLLQIGALLLGVQVEESVFEVKCLVVSPQIGTATHVLMTAELPQGLHPVFNKWCILGCNSYTTL